MSVGEWLNSIIEPNDEDDERALPADYDHREEDERREDSRRDYRRENRQSFRDDDSGPERGRDADRHRRDSIDVEAPPFRHERDFYRDEYGDKAGDRHRRDRDDDRRDREDRPSMERERDHERETARAREKLRETETARAREAEAARMRQEAREAEADCAREEVRAAEAARAREEARQAEAARAQQEAREAEAARAREEAREAEAARARDEARQAEAARAQEEAREAEAARVREAEGARTRVEARETEVNRARDEIRSASRRQEIFEAARQEGLREAARTREGLGEVHSRLDKLSEQLERIARVEMAKRPSAMRRAPGEPSDERVPRLTGAPPRVSGEPGGERSRLTGAPPQRPRTMPQPRRDGSASSAAGEVSIEDAVAEISARQRVLDGEPVLPAPFAAPQPGPMAVAAPVAAPESGPVYVPATAPAPTIDLSGLEKQLREITIRIEELRPTNGFENAIAAVRNDLAEIGHQITEALPRRAVESLEIEVKALAERIDHGRQSGIDSTALAGLEHGLAEVREALRGLTPAENLVGFDEAVHALAQKVDLIIAREDPAALRQLEAAIGGLRGIVSHVASNDTLTKVAEDVRSLAAQVDGLANSAATGLDLSVLEKRIDSLAAALIASTEAGHAVPRELEKLLSGLIEKLEWVQLTHTDHAALAHLEDRIATLVSRFDSSDARLGHLEAIERGLADLLVYLERMGGGANVAAGGATLVPPVMDAIEREVAEIKQNERRTQDSLEVVQSTVEHVVERLATLEGDLHHDVAARQQPAAQEQWPTTPEPDVEPEEPIAEPELEPEPQHEPVVQADALVAAAAEPVAPRGNVVRTPIDPSLPPDHPLEPGSASGRSRPMTSAAERIAASEAVIASTKPPVIADSGRPNFIAAARRAAQAAAWTPTNSLPSNESAAEGRGAPPSKLSQRLRKLIVAGGVVLIVIGGLHIAARLFEDGGSPPAPQVEPEKPPPAGTPPAVNSTKPPPTEGALLPTPGPPPVAPPSQPPERQSNLQSGPGGSVTGIVTPRTDEEPAPAAMPSEASSDITGTLPRSALGAVDDQLPATIGGPMLRAAAMSGDPAAQYEVATRFGEGRGVAQSSQEAARWLERAAKQGLAMAQFRLGGLYEKGVGVKKDLGTARDLYLAAADQGNGKAMHNLAVLYAEGVSGPPDYRNAAHWFREAADRGVTDSQYNLAVLYARGIGVEQNYGESYKWFVLAAGQGDKEAAKKRDEVVIHLDQQSAAAARLAAQTWSPKPQPAEAVSVKTAAAWDVPESVPSKPRPPGVKAPAQTGKLN